MPDQEIATAARQIESKQALIDYFSAGARPAEKRFVGAELEKLVVVRRTGEAAPYPLIEELLREIASGPGWQELRENGHLVALRGENSSITLEPGGQLELSGALCSDIHCCHGDLMRHLNHVSARADALGLAFLGLGIQPFTPLEEIDWLPKERYKVMGPYMKRVGGHGAEMMTLSAGLQVNLDFTDAGDCLSKLRHGMLLAPVLYALFANSPILHGAPTGYLSTRGAFWADTDPDRTGLVPELFADGATLETYVDYVLDVPMYFIVRDGRYLDMTAERISFARFWAEGFAGHRATLDDWALHASTVFPEIRLRPQLEVRSIDSLPKEMSLAAAALLKGLFYDPAAERDAMRLLRVRESFEAYRQAPRLGLKTPYAGHTLREITREILVIAREGLQRQKVRNNCGLDETIYLEGLEEIVETGVTLAERLLRDWRGTRAEKLAALIRHCAFS